ncbi:kinetochore protein NDC80 homolog isoform X2 [Daktulosphaira vitifoliae]|uniref:kinetochore protein NDC80 homolog isoform X2 n=1 Tax=Daktulosphaira vitifoliae TaxID=58002 RepID=UPI0021AA61EA|nr:kinetochore protein NDC80 homolog isoform X2 [Daktulosphaira vitifoliae]
MRKASCGRRSSAAGRNTFGGSTFGRQSSFDGSDIRLNKRDSRGIEKKSMLMKPGFSSKKSLSSDNLAAHDPKQWTSTVKKPSTTKHAIVRSTTNMNMTGINLVASTPCVTPGLNPNLPGINSSYKSRRLSTESRYSSYGVVKNRKEVRPLTDKDFLQSAIQKIQNYFLTTPNASHILNNGNMRPMTTTMFTDMCEFLLHKLDRNQTLNKTKYMEELPKIMKKYYYKGKVDKSWLITVNASHSFPQVVGLLLWLVELCETQNRFNVMETLYPSILDPDEIEDEDYEQTVEFKMYLPFLLNSYQVESRGTNKPTDKEFLQKQEELLLENYKNTLGVDEAELNKLETEVAEYQEELAALTDNTEEQKLEEMKTMKVAIQKDIISNKKYIKDVQICIGEVQEYIAKKKDERLYLEKEIENLKKELDVVKDCINGQQITQEDKKMIETEIISLKHDIQYEEECLTKYSNIVYSEDLNVVKVRMELDKLFVQYNTLLAENMVALPELENAIADKNVLVLHVRESLKEVDEILKNLKNKNSERLKDIEQKLASVKIELESVVLEYNNLKRVIERLLPERDDDKKRLLELTDRRFEEKKENENKMYKIQAEIKSIIVDDLELKSKIEERDNFVKILSEMEEEKNYIKMKTTNCLKNNVEQLNNLKKNVEVRFNI